MIGATFATTLATLGTGARREAAILAGQPPDTLVSRLYPVTVTANGRTLTYYVTGDYYGIGDETDFLRTPMWPGTAQAIADRVGAILPTPKMVDQIYAASTIRGRTRSYVSPRDTTARYVQSNNAINEDVGSGVRDGLVGGHKKDIVIAPSMRAGKVYIYGWHGRSGAPVQPLFGGHGATYVDYSHGVRLVSRMALLDGAQVDLTSVLADPALFQLISSARITNARYGASPPSSGGGGSTGGGTGVGGTGGGGTAPRSRRRAPDSRTSEAAEQRAGTSLSPFAVGAAVVLGVAGLYAATRSPR